MVNLKTHIVLRDELGDVVADAEIGNEKSVNLACINV